MKRPYITSRQFANVRRIAVTTSIALTLALGFGGHSASAQRLAGDDRGSVSVAALPERELTGAISGLGATTLSIGNQTVTISGAEVQGALVLGATVKVHVTVAADGSLAAREIVVFAPAASPSTPAAPVADDNSQDAATHDAGDDNGQDNAVSAPADDHGTDTASPSAPADDNGQDAATHDAADDKGQDNATSAPADDHSNDTANPSAPADDHGQDGATHNAGDDHGGSNGGHSSGSDKHDGGKHK